MTARRRRIRPGAIALTGALLLLLLIMPEFIAHAVSLGLNGLAGSRLEAQAAAANWGLVAHMLSGAVITVLAPVQLIPGIRRRWPGLHRWSGRAVVGCALVASLGGLAYIALHGTVGGWQMSLAFGLYGALVALCAVQTLRHARARRMLDHRDWAVRLFFLCVASFLYRVHYSLWFDLVGQVGTTGIEGGMTGWFDRVNLWAFYVPYLLAVELVLWRQGRGVLALPSRA